MIETESSVENPYVFIIFIPISIIRNLLITNHLHRRLWLAFYVLYVDATCDRLEVASPSLFTEVLLPLLQAVETSISRIALLCSSADHRGLVCERPGPCDGRPMVSYTHLAMDGGPRSCPTHRQGALLAPVPIWR